MKLKYLHLPALLLTICFSATAQVMQIPVVVHVVYNTAAQNISDAQIQSQIQVLNEDFNKLNADTALIPGPFKPFAVSTDIQFCLAGVDPNGNTTTGITRTQTTVPAFTTNHQVKYTAQGGKDPWNSARYLNIWICNLSGYPGYAMFPGSPASIDGVVLDYRVVGKAPANPFPGPNNKGRIATHEIGHYLNLHDIFTDSCAVSPGAEWSPQAAPNTGCPVFPHITCNNGPNGDMFMNFMDVTDDACKQLFTGSQRARMRAALQTMRQGLLFPMVCSSLNVPGMIHQVTGQVNQPVSPVYYSNLNATSWSWTLPGATPGASTASNPSVTYAAAGNYDATLTVGSLAGNATYTCQGCIHIFDYQVTGQSFMDLDQNGIFSSGDIGVPIQFDMQPGNGIINTDGNGNYQYYTNASSLTVTANTSPLPYYSATPASHAVTFTAPGQLISNKDFILTPLPNQQDMKLWVFGPTSFRPGVNKNVTVVVRNIGTIPLNGSAELQFDTNLDFVSATHGGTASGNILTWQFANLLPGQQRNYTATFNMSVTALTATSIHLSGTVLPIIGDQNPSDNSISFNTPVTNSFDPNDKTASHQTLTPNQVTAAQPITYLIRFQNTGNDTAFKVMLLDSITTMLNISTLQMLNASHPYVMQVDNERRTIVWHFDNIMLPDSTTNEPDSHGFVQYLIRPNTNLVLGDEILNQAHIYFDFNEAVATNITNTTVSLASGTAPETPGPDAFRLYPNPASEAVTFEIAEAGTEPVQATLYNTLGQPVQVRTLSGSTQRHELSLQGLPNGLYLLKVQQGEKIYQSRLVKQ